MAVRDVDHLAALVAEEDVLEHVVKVVLAVDLDAL